MTSEWRKNPYAVAECIKTLKHPDGIAALVTPSLANIPEVIVALSESKFAHTETVMRVILTQANDGNYTHAVALAGSPVLEYSHLSSIIAKFPNIENSIFGKILNNPNVTDVEMKSSIHQFVLNGNSEVTSEIVRNPKFTQVADYLDEESIMEDSYIRLCLVTNPNLTEDQIFSILDRFDDQATQRHALQNPTLSQEVLLSMYEKWNDNEDALLAIQRNPNAPEELVKTFIVEQSDYYANSIIRNSKNLSGASLDSMLTTTNRGSVLRNAIFSHPNLLVTTIMKVIRDPETSMDDFYYLAANPSLSFDLMEQLLNTERANVGYTLNGVLKNYAGRLTLPPEVADLITPTIAVELQDNSSDILWKVISFRNIPEEILDIAARSHNEEMRLHVTGMKMSREVMLSNPDSFDDDLLTEKHLADDAARRAPLLAQLTEEAQLVQPPTPVGTIIPDAEQQGIRATKSPVEVIESILSGPTPSPQQPTFLSRWRELTQPSQDSMNLGHMMVMGTPGGGVTRSRYLATLSGEDSRGVDVSVPVSEVEREFHTEESPTAIPTVSPPPTPLHGVTLSDFSVAQSSEERALTAMHRLRLLRAHSSDSEGTPSPQTPTPSINVNADGRFSSSTRRNPPISGVDESQDFAPSPTAERERPRVRDWDADALAAWNDDALAAWESDESDWHELFN